MYYICTMEKTIISTNNAPTPIGPYSQGTSLGNLVFISGQVPLNPHTGELVSGSIQEETEQVMQNLKGVLEAAGTSFDKVLKATIFLMDMGQFAQVNEVYGKYFTVNPPARECVQVAGLPRGVNVEISLIAYK